MADELIRNLRVTEQTVFEAGSGTVVTKRLYSFNVAQHGPFTLEFRKGEDVPERVRAAMDKQVADLRALGAIPAAGT